MTQNNEFSFCFRYKCKICETLFTSSLGLRGHMRLHDTDPELRPYACHHPGCGKAFRLPEYARQHFYHSHTEAGQEKVKSNNKKNAGKYYVKRK